MAIAPRIRSLLALSDYRHLWLIGAGVGVARWLEFIALSIFAYQVTGSPALVAAIAIVRMLPYALLGFLVGSVADVLDRRRLLVATFALALASALVMVGLALAGQAGYWTILIVAAVSGLVWTTDMPIRRRLLVEAAGSERIAQALGLDNSTMHATRAIGPLTGGAAYEVLGIAGIFVLIALVYAAAIVWSLRLAPHSAASPAVGRLSLATLFDLPWELLSDRRFRVVLGVTVVFNLWCFPFVSMIPVVAQRDLGLGPAAVGALTACDGLGGVLGALIVGTMAGPGTLFRYYYAGAIAFLLALGALALHLTVGTAVTLLLVMGLGSGFFSATQFALVYNMADPARRGRATGFLSIFIGVSTVGYYVTGVLFERLTSERAMLIMAGVGLAITLALGLLWRRASASGPARG